MHSNEHSGHGLSARGIPAETGLYANRTSGSMGLRLSGCTGNRY